MFYPCYAGVYAMLCRFQFDGRAGLAGILSSLPAWLPWLPKPQRTRNGSGMVAAPAIAAMLLAVPCWAQHSGGYTNPPPLGSANVHAGDGPHEPDAPEVNMRAQEQMADRRNQERQRELVADTEKLFQLAQQLRDEVAKSNKDQLSVPVMRRSEEIEKLAKSVKEKMRGY